MTPAAPTPPLEASDQQLAEDARSLGRFIYGKGYMLNGTLGQQLGDRIEVRLTELNEATATNRRTDAALRTGAAPKHSNAGNGDFIQTSEGRFYAHHYAPAALRTGAAQELADALVDMIKRLERCALIGGNDQETVDIMLAPARAALAKAGR